LNSLQPLFCFGLHDVTLASAVCGHRVFDVHLLQLVATYRRGCIELSSTRQLVIGLRKRGRRPQIVHLDFTFSPYPDDRNVGIAKAMLMIRAYSNSQAYQQDGRKNHFFAFNNKTKVGLKTIRFRLISTQIL